MADPAPPVPAAPLELWGGIECTVNRVRDGYHDQLELTGHDRRPGDLARVAALGIRRLRYPVLWERVAPAGLDRAGWTWTDERLSILESLGIAPIAGLVHHGSGPRCTSLLDPGFPSQLASYAAAVARRYPWIDAYTPINEPLTTARFSALYGHWYPHETSDSAFVRAVIHQCRATVLAMGAIRAITPDAQLVQTDDTGKTFSGSTLAYQAEFENERRWLGWDLISGRVDRHHPLFGYLRAAGASAAELDWFREHPCPPDVIGLNYYVTSDRFLDPRIERHPGTGVGGNGRHTYVDVEAVRARSGIYGHRAILEEAWQRYRRPVAITEAHLGCSRDEQMRWLAEAWEAAHCVRRAGGNVRAVTAWALFGLSDWDTLVTTVRGRYEPGAYDVRGPEPRSTALAGLVRDLAAGREPLHPVLASPGWWRRDGKQEAEAGAAACLGGSPRPVFMRPRARVADRRPIAILGRTGTLGRAFARICAARGLPCEVLGRGDLDITSGSSVAEALQRIQPWAVVNAAGYVRVDDAERDAATCRAVNTVGPSLLARACVARDARLVTFSSDLVFDGRSSRPYVESAAVAPLSVYGRSKAEADRIVLAECPDALVVRTSAFFGPWDRWNILHTALADIAAGRAWAPAVQQRVSPTYVPDLVHAALDLLVDGASGIWHLANSGDVSWSEFVRKAAVIDGLSDSAVAPLPRWGAHTPAPRPLYSVLGTERGQLLPSLDDALARYCAERDKRECSDRGTAA